MVVFLQQRFYIGTSLAVEGAVPGCALYLFARTVAWPGDVSFLLYRCLTRCGFPYCFFFVFKVSIPPPLRFKVVFIPIISAVFALFRLFLDILSCFFFSLSFLPLYAYATLFPFWSAAAFCPFPLSFFLPLVRRAGIRASAVAGGTCICLLAASVV